MDQSCQSFIFVYPHRVTALLTSNTIDSVDVIMLIVLNAQSCGEAHHLSLHSRIEIARTSKHRAAEADWQLSRQHSGGVNIPLIPAPNPTKFFRQINFKSHNAEFSFLQVQILFW